MRGFERTAIKVPGSPHVPAYQIQCSKCGAIEKVSSNTHGGSMAPEGIAARFRNLGWMVANKEHRDVCPKCQEDMKKQRKQPMATNVVSMPVVAVEPPREMSKEDRRLVFAKIHEVYLDEVSGYSSGWSDKRVAEDLGVPLAWVRSVREENFGTEGLNEDARPILTEAKQVLADIRVAEQIITERILEATKARDDLEKRANHLSGRIAAMEKLFK